MDIKDHDCDCADLHRYGWRSLPYRMAKFGKLFKHVLGGYMWYVMQVISGKERKTVMMMKQILSCDVLENCFIPIRRLKKKYKGKWQEITEKLFPGYVFLISGQPQLLYDELEKIPTLTKLLGSCEEYFTPLSKSDIHFLQNTLEEKNINLKEYQEQSETPTVELSKVVVKDNRQIQILSGPLTNLEGQIKKVNLHKRIAIVETEFMGSRSMIHLGIEIVNEEIVFQENR